MYDVEIQQLPSGKWRATITSQDVVNGPFLYASYRPYEWPSSILYIDRKTFEKCATVAGKIVAENIERYMKKGLHSSFMKENPTAKYGLGRKYKPDKEESGTERDAL